MNKVPSMSTCLNIDDYNKQMIEYQKKRIEELESALSELARDCADVIAVHDDDNPIGIAEYVEITTGIKPK